MTPAVKIVDTGDASDQLREVLERKLRWFQNLEKKNSCARLIHPLIARIELREEHLSALLATAEGVMAFTRKIYGPDNGPRSPSLSALCEDIANDLAAYPNITPGGVIQSRPFFFQTMQAFQDAWRSSILWAAQGQPVTSVQRFSNLRLVPGSGSPEGDRRPYATTTIHSDIWIGEPLDSVNGWLALCGDLANTVIQFYECSPGFLATHFGHERRYDTVLQKLQEAGVTFHPLEEKIEPHSIYLFDCLVPHRTCRGSGGARLSVDGRLRTGILENLESPIRFAMDGSEALRRQYLNA